MIAAADLHPLESTISVVGPVVGAIVILTLFFRLMNAIDQRRSGVKSITTSKALGGIANARVHSGSGKTYENVRIVGMTDSSSGKGMWWGLGSMLILEHEDGSQTLIQSKLVRVIEIPSKS
jgi:hypothetical protein